MYIALAGVTSAQFGLTKYAFQLISCIYSIEIIDFFSERAVCLPSLTGRSNNESATADRTI